jgi:predicted dehydrogenase
LAPQPRPFSWGIVGTGTIARQFAGDLRLLPDACVGAVLSRTEQAGRAFAAMIGAGKAYTALDAFLADPAMDAIYIASPNAFHAAQAIRALEAGKPVLVEKPLATSSRDAQAIADAAGRHGRFAMEALWSRFLPAVRAARALVRQGAIGTVTGIDAELAFPQEEKPGGRFYDPALGGGASLDLGVYPLSLAVHFLGEPTAVTGRWWAAGTGVDRRAEYRLVFGKAEAMLSCGFDREGRNRFTVLGTQGAIRLDAPFLKAQRLAVYGRAAPGPFGPTASIGGLAGKLIDRLPLPGRRIERFPFPGNGLQFEAKAVMEAVRGGALQSDVMPLRESVAVLRAIETVLARPPER